MSNCWQRQGLSDNFWTVSRKGGVKFTSDGLVMSPNTQISSIVKFCRNYGFKNNLDFYLDLFKQILGFSLILVISLPPKEC
jgi:hypothetical protein